MHSLPIPQFPIQFNYQFDDCTSPVSKQFKQSDLFENQEFNDKRSFNDFNLESEDEELMNAKTNFNTPNKESTPYEQVILPACAPLVASIDLKPYMEPKKADNAFVVSSKGRKMKKTEVMAALKLEYLKDPNWCRKKKEHLSKVYGLSFSQLYKLHWDWKEKAKRDVEKITEAVVDPEQEERKKAAKRGRGRKPVIIDTKNIFRVVRIT
jgi:hypothetical protein